LGQDVRWVVSQDLGPARHAEAAAAVMEVLFTFAQCYVVLNVATSKDRPDNGSSAWRLDSPWRSAPSP
jgi:hypothetical protein